MNRKVEIMRDNAWVNAQLSDVKKDDIFRLFETTGKIVTDNTGQSVYVAVNDAYPNEKGLFVADYKYLIH